MIEEAARRKMNCLESINFIKMKQLICDLWKRVILVFYSVIVDEAGILDYSAL